MYIKLFFLFLISMPCESFTDSNLINEYSVDLGKNSKYHLLYKNAMSLKSQNLHEQAISSFTELIEVLSNDPDLGHHWKQKLILIKGNIGVLKSLLSYHRNINIDGYDDIKQAITEAANVGDDGLLSELLQFLATYYGFVNQKENALAALEIALHHVEKSQTTGLLGMIYNQIGVTYFQLNQLAKAQYNYRQSLDYINGEGKPFDESMLWLNLARIYLISGDFLSAQRLYEKAFTLFVKIDAQHFIAYTHNKLGILSRFTGEFQQATQHHLKSIALFEKESRKRQIESINELALTYLKSGDDLMAEKTALISIFLNNEKNNGGELNDQQISFDSLNTENIEQFREHSQVNSSQEVNDIHDFIARSIIARIAQKQSKPFDLDKLNNSKIFDLVPIDHQLNFYQLQIEDYQNRSLMNQRDRVYQKVLTKVNYTRAQFDVSDLALHWTNQAQFIINGYINVLAEQQKYDDIFELLEKYHAINLREKRFNQTDALIAKKSEEIQQALDDYVRLEREVLLTEDNDKQRQADEAKEHFLALNGEEEPEQQKIELKYLTIEDVQSKLKAGQLLLRYYVSEGNAFVFVIDEQQWQVMKIPDQLELQPLIQQLISNIKNKEFNSLAETQLTAKVMPVDLINQGNYEKLIIIADGITHLIPFALLNIAQDDQYQPLTMAIDVERTYSASDYFTEIPESDHDKRSISIFANPVFLNDIDDYKIRNDVDKKNRLWSFDHLPHTGFDAQNIIKTFKGFDVELFTQTRATNDNFLSETNRNANIIHIGTHGFFNDKALDNVGIATSIIDENGQRAPGALAMREILYQPFKANLAVVSGCETTRGKQINGEGFNSLSRGLLSQGVNAVIGTIWSIPDRATSVFMKEFYINLRDLGGNVSKALNLTKRNFTKLGQFRRYRHPYYWAGFVLTSSNQGISDNIF